MSQQFWHGNVPTLLMVMPYTAIQFIVLHKLKTLASSSSKSSSQGEPKLLHSPVHLTSIQVYPNMRTTFVGILQHRGIQGLYARLIVMLIEIVPYASLQFRMCDTFKR
ncbi:unnamed protein product [Coffea canephora]|uniref:DH200=94 genomic scaffold, scaffold_658 n=1 Tax=Coffea canephora TaxID=49390 RepID=A0A068VGP3_COFCA|nr:unnamed protein product [Coffea canephora]